LQNGGDVVGKLAELTRENARLETELQESKDLLEKAMTASVMCIPNAPENNQQVCVYFCPFWFNLFSHNGLFKPDAIILPWQLELYWLGYPRHNRAFVTQSIQCDQNQFLISNLSPLMNSKYIWRHILELLGLLVSQLGHWLLRSQPGHQQLMMDMTAPKLFKDFN
jgi:hypothetical protein